MANAITTNTTYVAQDAGQLFYIPLFTSQDIRAQVTVDTTIKIKKKIGFIQQLEKITHAYATGSSFTASTGATITQKEVDPVLMKAQVDQNASAFFGSVYELVLNRGYNIDNITGTQWIEILNLLFMAGIKRDLFRQMFLGDTTKETRDTTYNARTGTSDPDYNQYDGWWARIKKEVAAGTIVSGQYVNVNSSTYVNTVAVAQTETWTLASTTGGTITLTISGVAYSQAYATSLDATVTAWVATNAAALLLRGITATENGSGVITLVSVTPGDPFHVAGTSAGTGSGAAWTQSVTYANVSMGTLKAGASAAIFEAMYNAMPAELKAYLTDMPDVTNPADPSRAQIVGKVVFYVSSSIANNYRAYLRTLTSNIGGYMAILNGTPVLTWDNIAIFEHPEWDRYESTDFAGVHPHKVLMTVPRNLFLGTNGTDEELLFEVFYYQYEQINVMRAEYKVCTQLIDESLVVCAY